MAYLVKTFAVGMSEANDAAANAWLKENPQVVVNSASTHPMHDRYTYGEGTICNQWEALVLICEEKQEDVVDTLNKALDKIRDDNSQDEAIAILGTAAKQYCESCKASKEYDPSWCIPCATEYALGTLGLKEEL